MIYKSPFEDVVIPETSLSSFILDRSGEYGDKPALIDSSTGKTITHNDSGAKHKIFNGGKL